MLKLTNNMLALGGTLLLQEVMALGAKAGFDPQTLYSVWSVSSGRGQAATMPSILERNWEWRRAKRTYGPHHATALGA